MFQTTRSCERAVKPVLLRDVLNAMSRVDVLDQSDLVAGGGTLTRNDGRPSKEKFPNLQHTKRLATRRCGSRWHAMATSKYIP